VSGLVCWLFALASKEVAVMLPVVLLTYDCLLPSAFGAAARTRLRRLYIPMMAFVAVAGVARLFVFAGVENVGRGGFSWSNLLVGLDVVRRYLRLAFLVEPQSIFHTAVVPFSLWRPLFVLNVLWFLVLGAATWLTHRRSPLIAFVAACFVLMLLPPVAMLVIDVGEPVAEQRAYLASCGFAMATGAAFGRLWAWPARNSVWARVLVTTAFGLLLAVMAARTLNRIEIWSDPVRLWREAAANAPDIWLPHRGLGDALRDKGDYAGAAAAYAEAARLRPQEAGTHLALGVALMVTGQLAAADSALSEATRLAPGLERAETARGMIARMTGRRDEARDRFLAIARAHPNAVLARQHLADMYENDYADYAGALQMCREVQALAPQAQGVGDCIARNQQRLAAAPAEKR
jgi:tetratricopeptide (TPR) repeat protein